MKKELVYNKKTGSFDKGSKIKSIKDREYDPETGSFERKSKIKKIKKSASKPRRTKKLKKKLKNLKKNKKPKKITKTRKSKTKTKKPKILHFYGYEFETDGYVEWAQNAINHLAQKFKEAGMTLKYNMAIDDKGKYWNCRNIYPTTKSEFIEKFFKKRDAKGIEGVWENRLMGTLGVVKEKSHYQLYNIESWFKDKIRLNFFEKLTEDDYDIDYSITSGTKVGALHPTIDKNLFRFEGVSPMIFSPTVNEVTPSVLYVTGDITINQKGNMYSDFFPPNPGIESYRIWPNKPVIPEEKIEDSKKSGLASGTGFFVDHSGHIITNYHVVEPCNNKTKILYKNKEYKTKLIAKDKNLDLALLKANVKNNYCIKTFDKPIKKLQSIVAAGYPLATHLGDDLKYTSGIISSLKGINDDTTQIQIDAALNPGNSGGPIIDKKNGELVAVAVSVAARRDILEGINFGIKVSQVKDFLYANGIEAEKKKLKNNNKNVSTILENSTLQILCQ